MTDSSFVEPVPLLSTKQSKKLMKLHVPVHFNIIDESHFTVSYLGHDKHYANIFQVNDLFSKGNNSSSICFTSSRSFVMVKVNRIKVMIKLYTDRRHAYLIVKLFLSPTRISQLVEHLTRETVRPGFES